MTTIKKTSESWTYDGPYDEVEVRLPSRWISIGRGESADLTPDEATALDGMPGWAPAKTTPSKEQS